MSLKMHWLLLGGAAIGAALCGALFSSGSPAQASSALEERKLPMRFNWMTCDPNCGWVAAVGIVTGDTPKDFDDFARSRDLNGATMVLDSSGGSVNDAITLGRRFRALSLRTTVGISMRGRGQGDRASVAPEAYCESMCVFLLLGGTTRYVPDEAHVRVHQIWMGDRADDAKAASYSAQDLMIVERDIGRLAKYTFDMGGAGDLLSLALSVPPWEDLHQLSHGELRGTNLVTTDLVAEVLPRSKDGTPMAEAVPAAANGKATDKGSDKGQDRFVAVAAEPASVPSQQKSTRTAEAMPTGTFAATPAQ
jgi:hypothetical protein